MVEQGVQIKVLIADDDALVAELVEMHLTAKGYTVLHAADGETALRLAIDERPALLMLDVMMPGMDGMEVLRRLRENESTRNLPVIMLTARKYQEDVVTALQLGAKDYLAKPFTPDALVTRVERMLGK